MGREVITCSCGNLYEVGGDSHGYCFEQSQNDYLQRLIGSKIVSVVYKNGELVTRYEDVSGCFFETLTSFVCNTRLEVNDC